MKKRLFGLTALLVLIGGGFIELSSTAESKSGKDPWKAPPFAASKKNPVASSQPTITEGRKLYLTACSPCHGEKGGGDGPAAASLETQPGTLSDPALWQQTDGAIYWKIGNGKAPMPAYKDALTAEQRWLIVNFVRTLAPKPDAAPNQINTPTK